MGDHRKALKYAKQHLAISTELGDQLGQATARMNVSDLRKVLGTTEEDDRCASPTEEPKKTTSRRKSMEEMSLIKMTPEAPSKKPSGEKPADFTSGLRQNRSMSVGQVLFRKNNQASTSRQQLRQSLGKTSDVEEEDEEDQDKFFDILSKCQSERMDDQRCSLPKGNSGVSRQSRKDLFPAPGGSLAKHHRNDLQGDKENKDNKSKVLPPRALSVPGYSSKSSG